MRLDGEKRACLYMYLIRMFAELAGREHIDGEDPRAS